MEEQDELDGHVAYLRRYAEGAAGRHARAIDAVLSELVRLHAADERAHGTARVWQQLRPYRPDIPAQLAIALNAQSEPYVDEEMRQLVTEARRAREDGWPIAPGYDNSKE
jgi:hypothetical protein